MTIKASIFVLALLLSLPLSSEAGTLGADRDGNGLWDDLDRVVALYPAKSEQANSVKNLANKMQSFIEAPPQNQSLAAQAMSEVQEALLCLYAVHGPDGKAAIQNLQQALVNNPSRAERFMINQQTIRGQELPFNPDPQQWRESCPS